MAFWSNSDLEPKRSYRFILELSPFEQWIVKKVNRPGWEISETEHKYLNHTFYYPGRITWKEVTCTIVDPVNQDSTAILQKWLMASGYRLPQSIDATRTITKFDATEALGNPTIHIIGGGDQVDITNNTAARLETWTLQNAWIKDCTLGDLDYESDDMVNIDLTLRYDYAKVTFPNRPADELMGQNTIIQNPSLLNMLDGSEPT